MHQARHARRAGTVRPSQAMDEHVVTGGEFLLHECKERLKVLACLCRLGAHAEGRPPEPDRVSARVTHTKRGHSLRYWARTVGKQADQQARRLIGRRGWLLPYTR